MSKGFARPNTAGFAFADTGYSRAGTPRHPELWVPPGSGIPGSRFADGSTGLVNPKTLVVPDQVKLAAMVHEAAPRIPWEEFIARHFVWLRGEHVGLVGPTGQGKTTMLFHLYPLHPFTVVLGTKPHDDTLDSFVASGFVRMEHWRSEDPLQSPRRAVWPQPRRLSEMVPYQRAVFQDAIEHIFKEGHWDIIIDEGYYIDEVLKLGALLRLLYTQVRSMGISLLLGTQRPAWVPVEVYDQSTHLFFWRDNDKRNLDRLREISVVHQEAIRQIVPNLERHQVLYLNTRTGFMCRTRSPRIDLPTGR